MLMLNRIRGRDGGGGRGRGGRGGGGMKGGSEVIIEPHRHEGVIIAKGWNPFRSKLAAAILGGVDNIWIVPGARVFYLGAASGTTDQVLVGTVDVIFSDVAQPDQEESVGRFACAGTECEMGSKWVYFAVVVECQEKGKGIAATPLQVYLWTSNFYNMTIKEVFGFLSSAVGSLKNLSIRIFLLIMQGGSCFALITIFIFSVEFEFRYFKTRRSEFRSIGLTGSFKKIANTEGISGFYSTNKISLSGDGSSYDVVRIQQVTCYRHGQGSASALDRISSRT
ncbi:hypothetical protein MKW98_003913 [Papaver atlanticum]|uniref:Uncharacterized protein n=1 Tax=Papaver atlanticum TaxID=357466 RepID=A0AAD4XIE3_9MAGN|nr:hypothetical protein MKW98_003913 [Papaver atlanticum]